MSLQIQGQPTRRAEWIFSMANPWAQLNLCRVTLLSPWDNVVKPGVSRHNDKARGRQSSLVQFAVQQQPFTWHKQILVSRKVSNVRAAAGDSMSCP